MLPAINPPPLRPWKDSSKPRPARVFVLMANQRGNRTDRQSYRRQRSAQFPDLWNTKAEVQGLTGFRAINGPLRCRCFTTPTTSWPASDLVCPSDGRLRISTVARPPLQISLGSLGLLLSFPLLTSPTPTGWMTWPNLAAACSSTAYAPSRGFLQHCFRKQTGLFTLHRFHGLYTLLGLLSPSSFTAKISLGP